MSKLSYPVPAQTWQTELEIKRSKFLTFAANAASREEAEQFIRSLREQHPQANHVCWAYIAGAPNTTVRSMSDDGEPSGTAGMPMLKVLQHSGLGDVVVAVVRYFGGVKLGTGGLQRAYSDAVAQVLAELPVSQKVSRTGLQVIYDYADDGAIVRLFERYDVTDIQAEYAEQITLQLAVADTDVDPLKTELVNLTAGNIQIAKNPAKA
ncbi:YigZ family protein [Neptunicella sp.]|uniref:YigZ family protein n=1 Tax=Neptunicella sp. TaxID=2125986 RepID=UPI003F68CB77